MYGFAQPVKVYMLVDWSAMVAPAVGYKVEGKKI